MPVKRSVSGYCPHLKRSNIIAVWFKEVKWSGGVKGYEKTDFECNAGYRSGCGLINDCPVYGSAEYVNN